MKEKKEDMIKFTEKLNNTQQTDATAISKPVQWNVRFEQKAYKKEFW